MTELIFNSIIIFFFIPFYIFFYKIGVFISIMFEFIYKKIWARKLRNEFCKKYSCNWVIINKDRTHIRKCTKCGKKLKFKS